jgi:hypothetical protein
MQHLAALQPPGDFSSAQLYREPLSIASAPYPVPSYKMVVEAPFEATNDIKFARHFVGPARLVSNPTGISPTM